MKRINKIILTILLIFTVISCKEADGISSGFYEIIGVDGITGNITIGNDIKTCTIIYGVDADITTGTSITFQNGRTDAVELTLINFKAESTTGSAIDFGNAGNFDHKLYIGGNCIVTSIKGAGIHVPEGVSLTIDKAVGYETDNEAKLTVTSGDNSAGIGGNLEESWGNIIINGGTIKATGGQFAAGLGGGYDSFGGTIIINSGVVTADGGTYGAGIGGGWKGSGGNVSINNGTVTAVAGYGGAGIGGGKAGYENTSGQGDGGIINISGGYVEATTNIHVGGGAAIGGGDEGSSGIINISGGTIKASSCLGAAIGSGYKGADDTANGIIYISGGIIEATGGVGIGGSYNSNNITITIVNGTVTATGGWGHAGIGGNNTTINIGGGTITATGGVYAAAIGGSQGQSSGSITISDGTVTATAGMQGAGIGGGVGGCGENITISGGMVTAVSAFGGAGIGGGNIDYNQEIGNDGGNITINGGTVIATCGQSAAGIGGGLKGDSGTIIINGGTITANCGNGISYEDIGGRGGAGIGGGSEGSANTITINDGTVTANGGYLGAGIGGGDGGSGGIINISNGLIKAVGGNCGAGIGGGRAGTVGTVTISGGTVNATGGRAAAGIGGGYLGKGGNVIINNSPVVIATGDYEDGAEHIGRGFIWDLTESEVLLASGTLKDGSGNDLSYLRFNTTDVSGEKFANINFVIKEINEEYLTDNNGLYWMFVPYIESKEYSCAFYKTGYAAVRKELALTSVSHDISAVMLIDDIAPVFNVSPVTRRSAQINSNDYGVFGTFYMVPKVDADYTSKSALEMVPEVITVDIEIPATYALVDASALENGDYQIYALDSAGNLSLPVNVSLPFSISSNNTYNKIATSENGNVSIQTTPTLNRSTKTAGIEINTNILDNAFSASVENTAGINIIGIDLPMVSGALNYETTLPANALVGDAEKAMKIRTEYATVILPGNMLTSEKVNNYKTATLSIKKADTSKLPANILSRIGDRPVIELSLMLDGNIVPWKNPDAFVTVSIPYTPTAEELKDPEHLVIWYIDSAGNITTVPSGRYDLSTGCVTFTTNHFSYYAIAFVQKTFSDISKYEWAKNQIEILASKEIINGVSEDNFSPSANITRADYLVLLIKTLGLTTSFENNFNDVSKDNYYYEAVGIARKLGITTGSGNNLFNPKDYITRQDMMVLTSRALEKFKGLDNSSEYSELDKLSDKNDISEYALDSISKLLSEELIVGSGKTINPRANTTRAEAAVFLYRLYNKY